MPQARLTGRSMPKVVRVNADDKDACLYKNLGNGRRVPFLWATTVTLASGTTEILVASGVEFNEFKISEGKFSALPLSSDDVGRYYIDKDTSANMATLKVTTAVAAANVDFDVMVFLGEDTTFTVDSSNQIWKRRDSNSM